MRDQKAMERARLRRPGAHARARAGAVQIDGAARSRLMPSAIRREMLLMRPPAELGRLRAFAHEAVHRPGVDELVQFLRLLADLGIPLGDVDDLDAQRLRELRPLLAAGGTLVSRPTSLAILSSACLTRCDTRPGFAPWVSTAVGASGPPPEVLRSASASVAHGVVAAGVDGQLRIGIAAGPGLDAGIEIQRAALARQHDERDARHVDG